jgi:hypothetical protein
MGYGTYFTVAGHRSIISNCFNNCLFPPINSVKSSVPLKVLEGRSSDKEKVKAEAAAPQKPRPNFWRKACCRMMGSFRPSPPTSLERHRYGHYPALLIWSAPGGVTRQSDKVPINCQSIVRAALSLWGTCLLSGSN